MLPPSEHAPSCMCACFNAFVCLSCLVFTVCTCLIPWSVAFNPGKSSIFCWRAEIQQRKLSLFVQVTRPVNATAAYHQWRLAESLIPAPIRSGRPSAAGTASLSPTRYLTLIQTENVHVYHHHFIYHNYKWIFIEHYLHCSCLGWTNINTSTKTIFTNSIYISVRS